MEEIEIAIVGGGPAGLRAAEVAADAGCSATVFDGKPSVGRKFLVAGKGGLNITHGEAFDSFVSRYSGGDFWKEMIEDFSPVDLRDWCHGLGQETFQASSGRVYPKSLKGAPVLRAWLARLKSLGVEFRPRHLWTDLLPGNILRFSNGSEVRAKAIIFALGGGSWMKTGSDGAWLEIFRTLGIDCTPLVSANCGWECDWPPGVIACGGMPLKNIRVSVGKNEILGELMVTRYGLEGGSIYALGGALRAMETPALTIDFKPTFSCEELVSKLAGMNVNNWEQIRKRLKLSSPASAILSRKVYADCEQLVGEVKNCRIDLIRPRPIDEAISSAGGVKWNELDSHLMLKKLPGVFVCGEMIDWDAPTGGYLLQAAFATGTRAGSSAAQHLKGWP